MNVGDHVYVSGKVIGVTRSGGAIRVQLNNDPGTILPWIEANQVLPRRLESPTQQTTVEQPLIGFPIGARVFVNDPTYMRVGEYGVVKGISSNERNRKILLDSGHWAWFAAEYLSTPVLDDANLSDVSSSDVSSSDREILATYDDECARGIVHTPGYQFTMSELRRRLGATDE